MIPEDRDAFGEELLACLRREERAEIIERDDGYIDAHGNVPFYFAPYLHWPEHERRAIALARGRCVDVGCGAGRVALYLQEKGLPVVGIDNSPLAIRVCRERGVRELLPIPFTRIDPRVGVIDTWCLFCNNFGLFGSFSRARWMLRRLKGLSSPDALILAESTDPYGTEDPDTRAYHERNRLKGRMPGQLRIRVRHRRKASPWFDYLLVSRAEMESIVAGTGWTVRQFIDGAGGSFIGVIGRAATGRRPG